MDISLLFTPLTLLGLGGGAILPPNLLKALKQKPFESLIYTFLTIPIYDGKRRRPDRVKKPVVKIPVDLVTDF